MTTEPDPTPPLIRYPAGRSPATNPRGGDDKVYIDSGGLAGPGRMVVDPDKLLQLKQGIDEERDRIARWLLDNRERLYQVDSPGHDPCSDDAVDLMGQNGMTAVTKADRYVHQLAALTEKLGESALTYEVVEDGSTTAFRQGPA